MQWNISHKKNKIMLSAATWMDPEVVIVSKGSETEKIDISSKKT